MRCPNCGETNEPGARFCFNCGTELAQLTAPEPPPAIPTTPASAPQQPTPPPAYDPTVPVWPPLRDTSPTPPPVSTGSHPADSFDFPPPPNPLTPPTPSTSPSTPPGDWGTTAQPAASSTPPPFVPPPPLLSQGNALPPQYPDWQIGGMSAASDEAEAPPRRGRNRFLMIVLGILLGCLILCVGLFIYSITPSGQDFFEDVGTSIADIATESADNS